ncbi:viperin family antiviral radical SAM protein [Polyangium sp. y55x31]|uniref:viperin family antiviral radical SAM protein n=1 Tax=Polyangium sp. y55x31 TaxID=3042688 RepID=UPI00248292AB|nr:viperin family antiviral radical SAM protein [Polyangium sp. y55x31]MDI1476354.1 viperin family antiviral radical SAM protein [Polyangium sp. y55x31]
MPPSVNFHLWKPCNMRCHHCFATFDDVAETVLPRGHLPRVECIRVVELLAQCFRKITFAGGEPTLCPWLPELICAAKARGAVTMLVTNGTRLGADDLARFEGQLDWITLSIDSAAESTHVALGRAVRGKAIPAARYIDAADRARAMGMRIKVNTVVTSINAGEDMFEMILALRPERWKILRVLPIEGQNSGRVEPLLCASDAFRAFIDKHRRLEAHGITIVPEDHEDILGSYAMVDPAGRFFDDVDSVHHYGRPILEVGVEAAWESVRFSLARFHGRGGDYAF